MLIAAGLLTAATGCATKSATDEDDNVAAESTESPQTTEHRQWNFPDTRRSENVETIHGERIRDPYQWLEPNDEAAVEAWMDRQDEFARAYLKNRPHRDKLRTRYEELYYIESTSTPIQRGGRLFYSRQDPDKQKDVYYWRPRGAPADDEQMLVNPNEMGGETNIGVGAFSPSPEGEKVAYTLHENNADAATLHVMDVESGEVSETDVIDGAKWTWPSWTPDGEGFYYSHYPTDPSIPKPKRPGKADVRYHQVGTPASKDRIVRQPTGDSRLSQNVSVSHDGRWLVATVSHGWKRSDVYYRKREATEDDWKPLVTGRDHIYEVRAWNGEFYIRTDEGASDYRLMKVSIDNPARQNWNEIVAEADEGVLKRVRVIGGHLVLSYLHNAQTRLEVREPDGTHLRDISLPEMGSVYRISGEPDVETLYYSYESFTKPDRVYETSVESGESELWTETDPPVDSSELTVEQVWYESKDGTKVSMFIVHEKGLERDGSTPFLLYGYGGFDISLTPHFRSGVMPWLEAGGGYAIPNLRGGGEYGDDWHEAGMLEKKQNTFDDFIAAAEYLIDEGYTSSERLGIEGRSNGGLLVSAVTTQRPELFGAVVCGVPLTDMLRYDEFGPGSVWIHEYGDPSRAEHFEFLYDYSPYHNVEKGTAYPAFLMMSSARDDRVHPMHARKMTAIMQWATTGKEPVLLRVEREAGHGGAGRIRNQVAKATDRFGFLMSELGVALD